MKTLMISKSRYVDDVRIRREAETLVAGGHEVTMLTLDSADHRCGGVRVVGLGEVPGLGRREQRRTGPVYRAARWLLLPEHRDRTVRQFQARVLAGADHVGQTPDVIHAHDYPALNPAATLADSFGARLIYDAHEFWSGMARFGRPEPLRRKRNLSLEGQLARRADAVITVSDRCAELLGNEFGLHEVAVVRNTFPARDDLDPPLLPTGAVYAGRIGPGRDLGTAFASSVWEERQDLTLHLMGPRDEKLAVPDRAVVHESGSMEDVDLLLTKIGIGLVTLTRGPKNHDVALPNKLFQAVSVGVPVVAADLPQLAEVVAAHRVGALYQPGDARSFHDALRTVVDDYETFTFAVANARLHLDWSHDASRLLHVYQKLAGTG